MRERDAEARNGRASPAVAGFQGDSIEAIQIHQISCNFDDTHYPAQRQGPGWEVASDEKMGRKRRGVAWGWGKWGKLILGLARRILLLEGLVFQTPRRRSPPDSFCFNGER